MKQGKNTFFANDTLNFWTWIIIWFVLTFFLIDTSIPDL